MSGGGGTGTLLGLGASVLAPELAPEIFAGEGGTALLAKAALGGGISALTGGNPLVGAGGALAMNALGGSSGIQQLLRNNTPSMFTANGAPTAAAEVAQQLPSETPAFTDIFGNANIGTPYAGQGALSSRLQGAIGSNPNNPYMNTMFQGAPVDASNLPPPVPVQGDAYGQQYTQQSPFPTNQNSNGFLDNAGNWVSNKAGNALDWMSNNPLKTAGLGLGAYTLYNVMGNHGNHYLPGYQPATAASYGLGRTLSPNFMPVRPMAEGGITSLSPNPNVVSSGPANLDFMGSDMYPQSQISRSFYATPTQAPTGAQSAMAGYEPATNPLTGEPIANMAEGGVAKGSNTDKYPTDAETAAAFNAAYPTPNYSTNTPSNPYVQSMHDLMVRLNLLQDQTPGTIPPEAQAAATGRTRFAAGGMLGGYSDGGHLLKGPGDGMSDNIPASIGDRQPARLADGEFVVPADVVSHLGNGSTDAGAKQLYAMLDKVRKARTGNQKQGKQINAEKFIPT